MKTSKPFSTISYNSIGYLTDVLSKFVQLRYIDFWAFIEHQPEDDEKKAHKHLFVVPNGRFDTDILVKALSDELDTQNLDDNGLPKRLGCIACRSSKFADWYSYAVHDPVYLASKGQSRRYHYNDTAIKVSDETYLNELKQTMPLVKVKTLERLKQCAEDGLSFSQLIYDGIVPINALSQYEKAYDMILRFTYRNGHEGHDE